MPRGCRECQWQNVVWCSVRDRLVSIGITSPCVVVSKSIVEELELTAERDAWQQQFWHAKQALIEAKAEIESLRKQRDGWEEGCWQTEQEFAEAKAEIEDLKDACNRQRDTARVLNRRIARLHQQREETKEELASYTASVSADAALGELVREMQCYTRLTKDKFHGGIGYKTESYLFTKSHWHPGDRWYDDPAEALRSIQEVGDAGKAE